MTAFIVDNATYVRVRVHTKKRRDEIKNVKGVWDISVRERPKLGAANKRARELLAKQLNIKPSALRLVAGATSPTKTFLLTNHKRHEDKL